MILLAENSRQVGFLYEELDLWCGKYRKACACVSSLELTHSVVFNRFCQIHQGGSARRRPATKCCLRGFAGQGRDILQTIHRLSTSGVFTATLIDDGGLDPSVGNLCGYQ